MGISLLFLIIDSLGGIFNTISLIFHATFDVPAATCFLIIVVCDLVVLVLYFILERRHKSEQKDSVVVEDVEVETETGSTVTEDVTDKKEMVEVDGKAV